MKIAHTRIHARTTGVLRSAVLALALCGIALWASGCATVESDLPWNTPQSWEGSTYIPGMSE